MPKLTVIGKEMWLAFSPHHSSTSCSTHTPTMAAAQRHCIMVDPESTVVGQVHALPDSEKELPAGKKPRIEVLDVSELEAGASRQYEKTTGGTRRSGREKPRS